MANFYTDHPEIKFNLESSPLMQRIVELKENGYADKDSFEYVLEDYADAIDSYNRVLEVAGDITANTIPLFYVFKNLLNNVFFYLHLSRKKRLLCPKKAGARRKNTFSHFYASNSMWFHPLQ